MSKEEIVIYTDGSSLGNPGPGGWGAVVLHNGNVVELGGSDKNTTNNKMELTAAIEALEYIKNQGEEIKLYTDSSYTINGITKWVEGWQANNWIKKNKTEVLNRDLWEKLTEVSSGKSVRWIHVAGHSGMIGNERADDIATSFAKGEKPKLYKGKNSDYGFDLLDTSYDEKIKAARSKTRSRSRIRTYSYLSLVDGTISKHKTWQDCEARVKGKKGVKYKKSISAEDEKNIVKEWSK
jgi:ribonuclease HI